jgi:hypothetical protein
MAHYAGIGARNTPPDFLDLMREIAALAAAAGWTLRSGGAPGADQAFASASPGAETYLPWPSYEQAVLRTLLVPPLKIMRSPTSAAIERVGRYHPAADHLSQGVRKLAARNEHILLGPRLEDPVRAVVCWTQDGAPKGGTGGALRIAQAHDIPALNLGDGQERTASDVLAWLESR